MKKYLLFIMAAVLAGSLVLAGCEGPTGPAGSPGAPGTPGGTGENGEPIISSVFGAVDGAALEAAFSIYNEVGVIGGTITLGGGGNAVVPKGKILNLYGDVELVSNPSSLIVAGTLNIKTGAELATNTSNSNADKIVVEEGGVINIAAGEAGGENPISGGSLLLADGDDTLTVEDGGRVSVGALALLFYAADVAQIQAPVGSRTGDTDAAGDIGAEGDSFAGVSNAKIEIATTGFIGTGAGGTADAEILNIGALLKVANNVYFSGALDFKNDLGGTVAAGDPLAQDKILVVEGDVSSSSSTATGSINLTLLIEGGLDTTNMTGPTFTKQVIITGNADIATATTFAGTASIGGDLTVSAALTASTAVVVEGTIIVDGSGSIAVNSPGTVAAKNFESQNGSPITAGQVRVESGGEIIVSGSGTVAGLGIGSTTGLVLPGSGYTVHTAGSAATIVTNVLGMDKVTTVVSRLTTAFGDSSNSFAVPAGKTLDVAAGGAFDDYFSVAGVLRYTGSADFLNGKINDVWAAQQAGTSNYLFVAGDGEVVLNSDLTVNMAGTAGDNTKLVIEPRIVIPGIKKLTIGADDAAAATYVEFKKRLDVHHDGAVEVFGANEDDTATATVVLAAGGIIDGTLTVTGGNGGASTNTGTAAPGAAGGAAIVDVKGDLRINGAPAKAVTGSRADGGTDDGLGKGATGTYASITGGNIVITGGSGGTSAEAEAGGAGGAATVTVAALKGKGGVAIGGGGGGGVTDAAAVGGEGGLAKLAATGITVSGATGSSTGGPQQTASGGSDALGNSGEVPKQVVFTFTSADGFTGTIAVAGGGGGGHAGSIDGAKDGAGGDASVAATL